MRPTTNRTAEITVACDEGLGARGSAIAGAVLAAWPAHLPAPSVEQVMLSELHERLAATPTHRLSGRTGVVLAIAGAGYPSRLLYQLADRADGAAMPTMLLFDGSGRESAALRRSLDGLGGMMVEDASVDAAYAAATLATLAARQPTIDRLNREIELGRISQQTVHDELTRVHREMHEAARMQQDFTRTVIPELPGLDLGVVFRPAGYVSGDLFEIERLDERHVGVFLADAVGHGMSAAMLTLFLSRALPRAERRDGSVRPLAPSVALSRLNAEFCETPVAGGRFATGVYGVIDLEKMVMRVAVAGHPPPLLIHPSGAFTRLEADGPLLGVFPDAEYQEAEVPLLGGGSVVLFSDGFETAYPADGAEGDELRLPTERYIGKLAELGRSAGDTSRLQRAVGMMQAGLDRQAGSLHQPDDVTALVIAPKAGFGYGRMSKAA